MLPRITYQTIPTVRLKTIVYSNTYVFLKKSEDHLKAENSIRAQDVIVMKVFMSLTSDKLFASYICVLEVCLL